MMFPKNFFDSDEKQFFNDFFKSSKFAAIFSTIRIIQKLDWSREVGSGTNIPLKPSD